MILFTKFSNDRRPELRICTDILYLPETGGRIVRKRAACPEAEPHVKAIWERGQELSRLFENTPFKINRGEWRSDGLYLEYLAGRTVEEIADDLLDTPKETADLLVRFSNDLRGAADTVFRKTEDFCRVFGDAAIPEGVPAFSTANIDMVLGNIIVSDGLNVIDYEWTFAFPVPVDFVVWRVLKHYLDLTEKRAVLDSKEIRLACGLSEDFELTCLDMEEAFQRYVDGEHTALRFLYEKASPGSVSASPPDFPGLLEPVRYAYERLKADHEKLREDYRILQEASLRTQTHFRETRRAVARKNADIAAVSSGKSMKMVRDLLRKMGKEDPFAKLRPELSREDCQIYSSVDTIAYRRRDVVIRGWAYDVRNEMEPPIAVRCGGERLPVSADRYARRDVSEVMDLPPEALSGFTVTIPNEAIKSSTLTIEFENETGFISETAEIITDEAGRRAWNAEHAVPVPITEKSGYNDWLEALRPPKDILLRQKKELLDSCKIAVFEGDFETVGECGAEFVVPLKAGDSLEPHALCEIAKVLMDDPETDMVYTDEDTIGPDGFYESPVFKPDFAPETLESGNYIGNGAAIRKSLLTEAVREALLEGGSPDAYDIIWRCAEKARHIAHVSKVLYHSAPAGEERGPERIERDVAAVNAHFARTGIAAEAVWDAAGRTLRASNRIVGEPLVSIIIPNRDMPMELRDCLTSILAKSTYRRFEILLVENHSEAPDLMSDYREYQKRDSRIRLLKWERPFNFSAVNNYAAREAKGEYLVFLNNDTEILTDNWIEELLGYCQRPGVGICGARLLYPDGTLQHGGLTIGAAGRDRFLDRKADRLERGYLDRIVRTGNVSAVTASCLMISRALYEKTGGFEEKLPVAYNDSDLAMKVRQAGLRVVYNPCCRVTHLEATTVGKYGLTEDADEKFFNERWAEAIRAGDPYLNRNIEYRTTGCLLKNTERLNG